MSEKIIHKGWLWALGITLLVAGYIYWDRLEYAHLDSRQRLSLYWLEEQTPQHIKGLTKIYSLEELTVLCNRVPVLYEGDEFKLLNESAIFSVNSSCMAVEYLKKKQQFDKAD